MPAKKDQNACFIAESQTLVIKSTLPSADCDLPMFVKSPSSVCSAGTEAQHLLLKGNSKDQGIFKVRTGL